MSAQQSLAQLGHAIDDLLVAHHGLATSLAEDHLPFDLTFEEALKHYGPGPLLHLWNECRLVARLRAVWAGDAKDQTSHE